jgi:hypothetical protein
MNEHPFEVDEFASVARAFTAWCENTHVGKDSAQMKREALLQLSTIYISALKLPGADFVPCPDPPSRTEAQKRKLFDNLRPLPFQYYWEMYTPTDMQEDKEPVCGDLFDDFLDIHNDLSTGLWLYDRAYVASAVFCWTQMFGIHWGRHVVSALHALHAFEPEEENDAF